MRNHFKKFNSCEVYDTREEGNGNSFTKEGRKGYFLLMTPSIHNTAYIFWRRRHFPLVRAYISRRYRLITPYFTTFIVRIIRFNSDVWSLASLQWEVDYIGLDRYQETHRRNVNRIHKLATGSNRWDKSRNASAQPLLKPLLN